MARRLSTLFFIMAVLVLMFAANALALDKSTETLTIKGDGVMAPRTFTRTELEAMTPAISQYTYSATNNFPTNKVMYRRGVLLSYLLGQAGVKDTARQIKFISSDGYTRTFTYQELLADARYYFDASGSRSEVPTMIAFTDGMKNFASMRDVEMVLTMGQRATGEQNNPWFVKYLQTIEVSTAEPESWPPVTFSQTMGPGGRLVELKHPAFDLVKIYYTTDDSTPTINSTLYNVSASYYQPDLNKPIPVADGTEIRAIAIGTGKVDSTVASYRVGSTVAAFSDLDSYAWARSSIDDLTGRGIISGMGDSRFAPEGRLTRAQFAKMIVLALDQIKGTVLLISESDIQTASTFRDIKNTDWYYGYVARAAELGLIKGYPDGTFRPDQVLKREEMLAVVVQAMGIKAEAKQEASLKPFVVESKISTWALPFVAQAEQFGILEHGHIAIETEKGLSFNAQAPTTRAEAAVTVYRMLNGR